MKVSLTCCIGISKGDQRHPDCNLITGCQGITVEFYLATIYLT